MPLLWSDECTAPVGTPPDPTLWGFDTGGDGFGGNEPQYATNLLENCSYDGAGHLQLIALKKDMGTRHYTSVRLNTRQATTPGWFGPGCVIEARFLLPAGGPGIHPSLWLGAYTDGYIWPYDGEIDLFEINMKDGYVRCSVIEGGSAWDTTVWTPPDWQAFKSAWHELRFEWRPRTATQNARMDWILDGQVIKTYYPPTTPPFTLEHPFYLINSLPMGRWAGDPDATTPFPQTMLFDYVRISDTTALTPTPQPPASTTPPPVGGAMIPAVQATAKSADWNVDINDLYAWGDNNHTAWIEFTAPAAGDTVALTVKHRPNPDAPNLRAGYAFGFDVLVNGVAKGRLNVPGNLVAQTASLSVGAFAAGAKLRVVWKNDDWDATAKIDANAQVVGLTPSLSTTPPPPPPPPPTGSFVGHASVKATVVAQVAAADQAAADSLVQQLCTQLVISFTP